MHRHQRSHVFEPGGDRAGVHPGGHVAAERPFGEQRQVETGLVGGKQQIEAVVELRVASAVGQRLQGFVVRLHGFGRAHRRHRDGGVKSELHHSLPVRTSVRWADLGPLIDPVSS